MRRTRSRRHIAESPALVVAEQELRLVAAPERTAAPPILHLEGLPVLPYYPGREASLRELRAFSSGNKVDMGGYWVLDAAKANHTMRPSATFNAIIDKA